MVYRRSRRLLPKAAEEAVQAAGKLGSTVVLKLYSEIVTHKTDVGGVKLNLRSENEIRQAYYDIEKSVREIPGAFLGVVVEPMIQTDGYELILGSSIDPQFGPVLLFGSGGQLVEVMKDYSLGLPPLNATLARRLMEQTLIFTALKGVRGRDSVNLAQLESVLVQFSLLVAEQPWIKEIDINPVCRIGYSRCLLWMPGLFCTTKTSEKKICRDWRFVPTPNSIPVSGSCETELQSPFDRSGQRTNP